MDPKLPPFLQVRDVPNQGKGIFTTKFISCGQTIFSCPPYSFGVGGVTIENVRGSCHHCLAMIRDPKDSVICHRCKVAGYCSSTCLDLAQPLHSVECQGLSELELLRGKLPPIITHVDARSYWPPNQVLMIARAINKRILLGASCHDDEWLKQLARHKLPSTITNEYVALIQKLVRYLVPGYVSDDEIDQMFRAVGMNAADVVCPNNTSTAAFYFEFSLLNHMCHPNCAFENDNAAVSVYALQDIECNSQLCITYLNSLLRVNEREGRRRELKKIYGFDCYCDVCLKEEMVGSEYWLLNSKKQSLIAPWSRKMADKIMKRGWASIRESERIQPLQAVKLLELESEVQKPVLDKVNIIRIQTLWQLVRNYDYLSEHKRGIHHLKALGVTGMNAFFSYSTPKDILEIVSILSRCFSEVGLRDKADKLFHLYIGFFPRAPGVPPFLIEHIKTENNLQLAREANDRIPAQEIVLYIFELCNYI